MSLPDWDLVLPTGAALCLAAGGYLIALLRLWPRAFLRRFPPEVQASVPPLSARERRLASISSVPLILMLVGFPARAAWQAYGADQATFLTSFCAAYAVWMAFNLVDWLIVDELIIGVLRPSWLILPGAEHVPLHFDHWEHAAAFLKGSVMGAVVAVVTAGLIGWIHGFTAAA